MKNLFVLALVFALCSCKKCYKCTVTVTGYQSSGVVYGTSITETNFCGTPYQKTKYEKEGSSTKPGVANSKTVTKTLCHPE